MGQPGQRKVHLDVTLKRECHNTINDKSQLLPDANTDQQVPVHDLFVSLVNKVAVCCFLAIKYDLHEGKPLILLKLSIISNIGKNRSHSI